MPAHSNEFPWPSFYGHFQFFENAMLSHRCVTEIGGLGEGLYRIERPFGKPLLVFVCQCYSFGVAEYIETINKLGSLDAIVIDSAWCGFTFDAKRMCYNEKVGLFQLPQLMGALNKEEIWTYLTEDERDIFKKRGWL